MGTRIQLVGPIAVLGDGGVVTGAPLAGRRVRLALAALALSPDGLSARALADRIWDEPPSTWSAALRGTVLALRGALDPVGLGGQELVRTIAGGWALSDGVEVDVVEAGAAVSAAERMLADGAAESALEAVESVSAVTSGELMADEDAAWVEELRARLASVTDRALAVEGEAALILGRNATAAETARRLIERNPLDESAHRILIRALSAAGDRAGAIRAYEDCREVLGEQLGADPGPETTEVYLAVLRSGAGASGNLPPLPRSGFFGRGPELERAVAQLSTPGATTVLGRGGVGKSRFALHAAHAAASEVTGGRFWVSLGSVPESALVAATVARAVGADEGADPTAAIIARLAPLGPCLLVLDGGEDVVDGVAELLLVLLAAAPELRALTTSRRPIDLPDERKVELAPLDVLAAANPEFVDSAAVRLLTDRVAARGGSLPLDARNRDAVRALCDRCGGVPLALELAAAQLSSIAVSDLLDQLPSATRGAEDVVESLLTQSVDTLGSEALALFLAWGAIEGGLPLSLATALVPGSTSGRTARVLGELAEHGLLLIDRSGPRWRYRQDDQVRRFARRLLGDGAGATPTLTILADGLRALLPEDAREPPAGYRDAATEASDGFRTVFAGALDGSLPRQTGLELAFRLHRYWAGTGLAEGRYWLTRLLDGAPHDGWAPFASFAAGYLSYWAGDTEAAQSQLEDAASRLRGIDDNFAIRSLVFASGIADDRDRAPEAMADIRIAVQLAEQLDDPNLLVTATISIASILAERGDVAAAEAADRAITLARERGSRDQLLATFAISALLDWQVGAYDRAREILDEASELLDGEPRISRSSYATAAAGLALLDGRLEQAARLAELALRDAEELGVDRVLPLGHSLAARIAIARGRIGAAATSALAAIEAAEKLDYPYPMAICLETAAELAGDDDASVLRGVAARIRAAGDRPAPAGLAPQGDPVAPDDVTSIYDATGRARSVVEPLVG